MGPSNIYSGSPTPTVANPVIKATDAINGKSITISTATSGATIHYTRDGKTNPTPNSGTVYSKAFADTWSVMGVRAIASRSGYAASQVVGKTFYSSKVATPTISLNNTPAGVIARVTSTSGSTIYYTTDGSDPSLTNGKKYTGDVKLTSSCTFKALAVKKGMINSAISTKTVTCSVPAQPTASVKADRIAVNDAMQVSWNADSAASGYTVTLYKDGKALKSATTQGSVASFTLEEVGSYQVGVKANNYYGTGKESALVGVEAMADCTVRFVDTHEEDETLGTEVLNEQVVRYGYAASKPPSPTKRGYSFAGWDGLFTQVTADTEVQATWDINKYKACFYAEDGSTLLSKQLVTYRDAAEAPEPPAARAGYVFDGWQVVDADDDSARDYKSVDSNMKLRAVFSWEDAELPNVAQITTATRTAEGIYLVGVKIDNYPYDATTALLRVALKTKAGKLVQTARETVALDKGGSVERMVTLRYSGDYIATVAEVELVGLDGNYRTGGAYSKAVTAEIKTGDGFSYGAWSDWSADKPVASDTVQVEQAVQYRYRDKQTTTSTAASLDGWTRDGTTTNTYSAWSANKTTTSKPTAGDTLKIVSSKVTKYNYYHYHSKYDGVMNQDSCWVNNTSVKHTLSTTSPLAGPKYFFADKGGKASSEYGPGGTCAWNPSKAYWWLDSTVTTYTYQTRTKTVNYGYYRWDDNSWSEWSTDAVSASSNRQVETRTVWRYRTKQNVEGAEDATGTSYTVKGSLDTSADLSGREATVMVYNATNTDPNEDQLQYIGQIVLGAGNAYDFSFVPKKELSAEGGDLIVALGIKGATGLVNIDVIKAPRAQHEVVFQYVADGDKQPVVVSRQTVAEGDNAAIPDAPQREGYRFAGWSDSAQRINGPLTVTAQFVPETYTVAWVNWASDDIMLQTCNYGDALVAPESVEDIEGMTFKGWDALMDGTRTVTGNMVVNAVYDTETFTVKFVDETGKAIDSQQVEYGESAELPAEQPESAGKVFMGWSTSEDAPWWRVTSDLTVGALFAYEETVNSPIAEVPEETGYVDISGAKVYLESSTEDADIYYTTDGSEPAELVAGADEGAEENTSQLYNADEGITVTEPTTIRAFAVKRGMNDSCETQVEVDVTATNDIGYAECVLPDWHFYEGEPVDPGVSVWFGDVVLEPGVDYTVSCVGNDEVGTATAFIEGIGRYTGYQTLNFEIAEYSEDAFEPELIPIEGANVELDATSVERTGSPIEPDVTVTLDGTVLERDVDYTVAYRNNTDAGTATVEVTGTGIYSGTATATFTITDPNAPTPGSRLFKDVQDPAKWYFALVYEAVDAGLITGYDDNTFKPDAKITRGQLATILWRAAGSPGADSAGFSDVKGGQYYTDAVNWAAANGVVTGYVSGSSKTFKPNSNVTRQDMVLMLSRYVKLAGGDVSGSEAWKSRADANKVASYAKDAIAWGVDRDVIGSNGAALSPTNNATRAEATKMLLVGLKTIE